MNFLSGLYYHKYFPRLFYKKPDGGKDSGVTAYFLIEWKILFSIALLKFKPNTREAYHNHAFHAYTWWVSGDAVEEKIDGSRYQYQPYFRPKFTPRNNFHRVSANNTCYALTIRGPWLNYWYEKRNGDLVKLTHGRKRVDNELYY
jgi:hypothetical protein